MTSGKQGFVLKNRWNITLLLPPTPSIRNASGSSTKSYPPTWNWIVWALKKQGVLNAYKKALGIINDIDATDMEKRRMVDEVERELNITDIKHEEVGG
jgi:hypothetical protein